MTVNQSDAVRSPDLTRRIEETVQRAQEALRDDPQHLTQSRDASKTRAISYLKFLAVGRSKVETRFRQRRYKG